MPFKLWRHPSWLLLAVAAAGAVSVAIAATALSFSAAVNVSQTAAPSEKAKNVRLAYQVGLEFRKAWLYTYGENDGASGRGNVYARRSFDEGATWSAPVLLSRDGAGNATGGQVITTAGGFSTAADNNKPNIFAPPITSGPKVVVSWTSAYCPSDPLTGHAGSYTSAVQGQSALVSGGAVDHPFHCLWVATTTDPELTNWTTTQLTTGARDALGDVLAGNSTGTSFALAWQEDPAGLKPGEAEGPGDGGSGATVTPGTNIWYSAAPSPNGLVLRSSIRQASDNNSTATGAAGASRPNLGISGSTAALAYEESSCPGGSSGKCIVYHSFPTLAPTFSTAEGAAGEAGAIVSDVTQNARRVRLVLQGASAAPTANLRTLLLWRESAATAGEGAPADIVVRRGIAGASASASSGYAGADILVDSPRRLTDVAASGGNANAHRALIRNNLIALAYDQTPSMDGANPEKTQPTTATYNLFLTRSTDSGASWDSARNLSGLTEPGMRVVEPRLVPTPGTVINPVTGVAGPGDTQDVNVFYVAYGTEKNDATGAAGRVYVSRSIDQGQNFEAFVALPGAAGGQSEAQLRPTPDGSAVAALWMQEQTVDDPLSKDALFAVATPALVPAPEMPAGAGCSMASQVQQPDPLLPLLAVLGLLGLLLRRKRQL